MYTKFQIDEIRKLKEVKIPMVAIPLDKINYNKVSKYANVIIFKEFYPKTKNVSYYLNDWKKWIFTHCWY